MSRSASPRVSVVLPTYDRLDYLPISIDSLLTQSFADFELIVVDDGSRDGTAEFLDRLEDPRVRVIHQDNRRLPAALNRGFEAARGELCTWVSSDNYCAPIFLEALVAALDWFPEAGFASSAFAWIDGRGRITRFTRDQDLSYRGFLCANPGTAAFMYRRASADRVGVYDPELEGAEDWDMWLRLLEREPAVYVPEILCYYREHAGSMTDRMPERVSAASREVFRRAVARAGDALDLSRLYPGLVKLGPDAQAECDACWDFGARLLRSPFADARLAERFLEAAFERRPDSPDLVLNLAVAAARAGNAARARELTASLRTTGSPQIGELADRIERAATGAEATRPELPVFPLDLATTRIFERETPRVFSATCAEPAAETAPTHSALDLSLSFCIITGGKRPPLLSAVIQSIRAQAIPELEIVVAGRCDPIPGVRVIEACDAADAGRLGELRNLAVAATSHANVVIMDDDIVLAPDWYRGLREAGEGFDILTSRLKLPDGTRYWDHATCTPARHAILDADDDGEDLYMTGGGAWIMRREVAKRIRWDPERAFDQGEDIDFAQRCREAGFRIRHNARSTAYHLDPSYSNVGRSVFRRKNALGQRWVVDEFRSRGVEELIDATRTLAEEGRIAESMDCLRYAEERHPELDSVRELREAFERTSGGALADSCWSSRGDPDLPRILRQYGVEPATLGDRSPLPGMSAASCAADAPGVNLFGFLSGNLGLGVSSRNLVRLLRESGVEVCPVDVPVVGGRSSDALPRVEGLRQLADETPHAINVFVMNPFDLRAFIGEPPPAVRTADRVNLCLPFWELARIPQIWIPLLERMDGVLGASRFIESALLASLSNVAVRYFPQPLFLDDVPAPDRTRWGFPDDTTVFVTSFEMASDVNRKNPFGAIDAFEQAFAPGDPALLVVKINNSRSCTSFFPHVDALAKRAARHPGIRLLDVSLPYDEVLSLYASCDVLVSLHRAEGLGLCPLEGMALGKPVIATGWSGNLDFMDDTCACLVGYRLVPVQSTTQAAYKPEITGPGALWADPDLAEAAGWMQRLADDPALRRSLGKRAGAAFAERHARLSAEPLLATARRAATLRGLRVP